MRTEIKFVEGSGNQFEIKKFGEVEGADGLPVEVVTSTSRMTISMAKNQYESAKDNFETASTVFETMKVAVKKQAAKILEEDPKGDK